MGDPFTNDTARTVRAGDAVDASNYNASSFFDARERAVLPCFVHAVRLMRGSTQFKVLRTDGRMEWIAAAWFSPFAKVGP